MGLKNNCRIWILKKVSKKCITIRHPCRRSISLDSQMRCVGRWVDKKPVDIFTERWVFKTWDSWGSSSRWNTYHDLGADTQNRLISLSLSLEVEERNTVLADASLCLHTLLSVFCFWVKNRKRWHVNMANCSGRRGGKTFLLIHLHLVIQLFGLKLHGTFNLTRISWPKESFKKGQPKASWSI